MSEQTQRQPARPRVEGAGARSPIPPRPATRPPPSAPKAPPARAVSTVVASPSQLPAPPTRGSTPPPLPVRASLPPPPLLRATARAATSEPPPPGERPVAPVSTAPSPPGGSSEELRRLVGQANDALAALLRVIGEMERLVMLEAASSAPGQRPLTSSAALAPLPVAGASAFRRLASRLAAVVGRLTRAFPPIKRLYGRRAENPRDIRTQPR
jgi:hypothetical protein